MKHELNAAEVSERTNVGAPRIRQLFPALQAQGMAGWIGERMGFSEEAVGWVNARIDRRKLARRNWGIMTSSGWLVSASGGELAFGDRAQARRFRKAEAEAVRDALKLKGKVRRI